MLGHRAHPLVQRRGAYRPLPRPHRAAGGPRDRDRQLLDRPHGGDRARRARRCINTPSPTRRRSCNGRSTRIAIASDWIIRVDCDEYLEPALIDAIQRQLPALPADVTALDLKLKVLFKRQVHPLGRLLPHWLTRLWRPGAGRMEQRWMDERLLITRGRAERITGGDLVDASLKDIGWWAAKHNGYATRQMIDFIAREHGLSALPTAHAAPPPPTRTRGLARHSTPAPRCTCARCCISCSAISCGSASSTGGSGSSGISCRASGTSC